MLHIDYAAQYSHPLKNFNHGNYWDDKSENHFGDRFSIAFQNIEPKIKDRLSRLIAIREFPIFGNGIADLLVVQSKSNQHFSIQSFEFKMNNWRKGIMQANRYKCFSNSTVLVLHNKKSKQAIKSLDLFRKLDIGLWIFNPETNSIRKEFTPRSKKIKDFKKASSILEKALEVSS